jgi:hypothetical protein
MDDTVVWYFSFFHRGLKEETGLSYSKLHLFLQKILKKKIQNTSINIADIANNATLYMNAVF